MKHLKTQVCVLGGGPAGASAAIRLRAMGHSVIVIEKAAFPRPHIGESLIAAVLPLLDVLGIRDEIEGASFLRTHASLVRWAGPVHRWDFSAEAGFQVDRSRFDDILLRAAATAGAEVMQSCRLENVTQNPAGGWALDVRVPNGETPAIDCAFLVDATGRSSVLGGARESVGARTLALYAYWRDTEIQGSETRVEAGRSEWFWGAPLPGGLFNATVFIDPKRYQDGIAASGSLESFYTRLIASSQLLSGCLKGVLHSRIKVCDATCTYVKRPLQGNAIKAGEAAYTIDPLSSQGVQAAIGSGLHAAVVVHTILERPADSGLAERFYLDRLKHSVDLHADAAARFYAEAGTVYPDEFWQRRSDKYRSFISHENSRLLTTPSADGRVQRCRGIILKEVPVVHDDFVVARTGVLAPHTRVPVIFIDGIQAAPLIEMIDGPVSCAELLRRWTRFLPLNRAVNFLSRAVDLRILQISPHSKATCESLNRAFSAAEENSATQ